MGRIAKIEEELSRKLVEYGIGDAKAAYARIKNANRLARL